MAKQECLEILKRISEACPGLFVNKEDSNETIR